MTSLYERDTSVPPAEIAPYRSTKTRPVKPASLTVAAITPADVRDGTSYDELMVTSSISVVPAHVEVAAGE